MFRRIVCFVVNDVDEMLHDFRYTYVLEVNKSDSTQSFAMSQHTSSW